MLPPGFAESFDWGPFHAFLAELASKAEEFLRSSQGEASHGEEAAGGDAAQPDELDDGVGFGTQLTEEQVRKFVMVHKLPAVWVVEKRSACEDVMRGVAQEKRAKRVPRS